MNLTPDKSRLIAIPMTDEETQAGEKLFAEHGVWFESVKFKIRKGNGGRYLTEEERNLFWRLLDYNARKRYYAKYKNFHFPQKKQVQPIAD